MLNKDEKTQFKKMERKTMRRSKAGRRLSSMQEIKNLRALIWKRASLREKISILFDRVKRAIYTGLSVINN